MTSFRLKSLTTSLLTALLMGTSCLALPALTADPAPRQSVLSAEPFYAGIIASARRLQAETQAFAADPALMSATRFVTYDRDVRALAAANMQGHEDLKSRGTDNDLKCILKGVSLDMTTKMDAIVAADTPEAKTAALEDMAYLLSDNIDVIVTPATADSGLDCIIEFGA